MIRTNNPNQRTLFDPWDYLSPKRRTILEQSWSGLFREEILCELPVQETKSNFSKTMGRPTKELYTMLGVLLLQQAHNLTDEETVAQLAFNIQWHYALNITEESDDAKYISLRTLWGFRKLLIEKELDSIIFDKIATKLAKCFNVNLEKQRIDSVHIKSNMRRLGRISIFSKGIHKFLVNVKRKYPDRFREVESQLVEKYFSEKSLLCFSMVKPSDSHKTLKEVSNDLYDLIEQFKGDREVRELYSYKLMNRILSEHCNIKETSDDVSSIEIKSKKEIPSDSLQNPSDPDASYSGHKGQGYQVQIMETYTKTDDNDKKKKALNLITYVKVEKACESDAKALEPALESVEKRNLSPKEVVADSLYGSDDNCEAAKSNDIELVSPTMGTIKSDKLSLSDFEISDEDEVEKCPQGYSPVFTRNKTGIIQGFNIDRCSNCPLVDRCPVEKGKEFYYLRYTMKAARLAKRRKKEQSEEFKDRYRWRAGVEGTISEYDRRTGVKHLRFRGFGAVRFAATIKAAAINIFRATVVRNNVVYA